ncbi:MAG TPA: NADH dehydrogenase (quinone) subunit D [Anaerolineae bacterium]|nr:NADH dehydrogenase (quinone) subunit D [Anaerolineae bacterium]HIQ05450.1 NADH dehydrogenase (quinone) subunit D [Anaerolineae bacterium]
MSDANGTVERLRDRFPDAVQEATEYRGDVVITVRADKLLPVARFLHDESDLAYDLLVDMTAVDRSELGRSPRFMTVYQLHSTRHNQRVRLHVPCPGGNTPHVPSVTGIWPAANWHEREAYDLMGVRFEGHPDLRRILLPDDWEGHPLRKDYPLGGEPVPFSLTWNDPEFENLGKQVLPAESLPPSLPVGSDTRHMVINMGPQHPATHGVLRLIVELDGERVVRVLPDIGYLHSGFEKTGENKRYRDFVPYTDRMDYVAAMSNNLAYALAVEKLLGIEVPSRAQVLRVIMVELQRIASHLVWLATHALDISGTIMSLLMYAFREREMILDIFEMVCGARLTTSYIRIGGVWKDVPPAFEQAVRDFLAYFPARIDDYEQMLTDNPIFRKRLEGIGKLTTEDAIALGVTGPMLRATGLPYDIRRVRPYCGYEQYDFEIPTATEGDSYARYLVRMQEMRQSLRIIEQALDRLPDGLYKTADRKVALPPREELDTSMEALIHHFKLVTEGIKPPSGEVFHSIENPKGELGYLIVSDGSPKPYRLHIRTPSFVNLQATDHMARGHLLSDIITIIGSIDIVLGDVDR